jgi:hypothetical protein
MWESELKKVLKEKIATNSKSARAVAKKLALFQKD